MCNYSLLTLLLFVISLAGGPGARAQSDLLDLPRESQRAEIAQRIGLTNITNRYHRPLVKGRKIFGGVAPYGEVWRTGANENTIIEFGDAVTVEGKPLAKGVYGLYTIPGEREWIVIFSKNSTSQFGLQLTAPDGTVVFNFAPIDIAGGNIHVPQGGSN